MRSKQLKWWIIGVVITPFALMLCLHISIALQQYFKFNINVPNIEAADWFMFAGSYLGGVMTLAGVVVTLKHERKVYAHQQMLASIQKENDKLSAIISNLDFHAPYSAYLQFCSVASTRLPDKVPDYSSVRKSIAEQMSILNRLNTQMHLDTNMFCIPTECSSCKAPCRLPAVRSEFQALFDNVYRQLYETLSVLYAYIGDTHVNNAQDNLICAYEQDMAQSRTTGRLPNYSEADIALAKSKKINMENRENELVVKLKAVAAMPSKELIQLVNLSREYIGLCTMNAETKCFGKK